MTLSLRERLEAKKRRTGTLPVQVGDTAGAAQETATLRAALEVHLAAAAADDATDAERERVEKVREQLAEANARLADTVVHVELQALEPDVWDEIMAGLEYDDEGSLDLDDVRAALLAASCADESLRDVEWWQTQLDSPAWSKGDKLASNRLILSLNLDTPVGSSGKG